MNKNSTINDSEMAHFSKLSNEWWEVDGQLKTLHDINPVRLEFVEQHVEPFGKKLLDIGCGGGIFSEALAKIGAQVTGLDSERDSIQVASSHAKTNDLNIEYVNKPVETFEHTAFDIITCMEMLEHVDEPELVIKHMSRLSKTGTMLFLSTINRTLAAYLGAIVASEYLLNIIPKQTHDYKKFIRPSELAKLLRKYDFEIVDMKGLGYNPLTRDAFLQQSVKINYLIACRKK